MAGPLERQLLVIKKKMAITLTEHGASAFGPDAIAEAWMDFWIGRPDEALSMDTNVPFAPYLLYKWLPDSESETFKVAPKDTTIALDYLNKHGQRHTPLERRFLEESIWTPFSFHDVREVDPGLGFRLRDILLGSEVYLAAPEESHEVMPGDILFGQLIRIDSVNILNGAAWFLIPPIFKHEILTLRKALRESEYADKWQVTAETLDICDLDVREVFLDIEDALFHTNDEDDAKAETCDHDVNPTCIEQLSSETLAQLREESRRHWDTWFSTKIPVLCDRTPLEAAQDADGRDMLESLILHYQRGEAASGSPYPPDYNRMRERLGLPPAPNGLVEKSRLKEMMR